MARWSQVGICPYNLPQAIVPLVHLSTSGFQDIGLGMEGGSGSLAIGSFLPVFMPNGFLVTGGLARGGCVPGHWRYR